MVREPFITVSVANCEGRREKRSHEKGGRREKRGKAREEGLGNSKGKEEQKMWSELYQSHPS